MAELGRCQNMKRYTVIFSIFVTAGFAWLAVLSADHIWVIGDVAKPQERSFTDWFHSFSSGQMAIRVTGNLDAPAVLDTPLGQIDLPTGDFDFITYASESWSSSATFRYTPIQNTKGKLRITVCLGSNPDWVHRPPPSALPTLYTGGWTAYYTGTDKKAWHGGFHHGQKWGEFVFWDEAGNITKKEEWEAGRKKNGIAPNG